MERDTLANIEDNELLERYYADGNSDWLGILLKRYTLLLLGVCMKYLKNEEDARDSVQQIFLKTITEIRKYKVAYFKSWLYMVARNYCLMRLRDREGKISVDVEKVNIAQEPYQETIKAVHEKEKALTLVEEGLQQLNDDQKTCLTLFYLQKQSYQQIAESTGYTLLQVKSFIQNGKRNLKMFVERKMKLNHG